MIAAYHRRLTHADPAVQLEAARAWSAWEGKTLSLLPDAERVRRFADDDYALAFARIECHYFVNRGFFDADDQLIADALPLKRHSRRDRAWPLRCGDAGQDRLRSRPRLAGSELRIVPDAGHAMTEPGIVHELVAATDGFARSDAIRLQAAWPRKLQRDAALMRAVAVLDDIDALPGAERHPAALDRDAEAHRGEHRLDVARHVVGALFLVRVVRPLRRERVQRIERGPRLTLGSAFSWMVSEAEV